ncbi:MAG: hypothetical protein GX657_13960 [Chloroflexi bacterium]|jgi:hypothetical protein|nr:hypothetical protein [Chloroflexota bacterium]
MSTATHDGWGALWQWLSRHRETLHLLLDLLAYPSGRTPVAPEPLQRAVEEAFQPVAPSTGFRQQLRHNLSLAASSQGAVAIEDTRPYRRALLWSVSAAVLAAGIATAVALTHSRWANAER